MARANQTDAQIAHRFRYAADILEGMTDGIDGDRLGALIRWARDGRAGADEGEALIRIFEAPHLAAIDEGAWDGDPRDAAHADLARWTAEAEALAHSDRNLQAEVDRLRAVLNTPEVDDFVRGAVREAQHQRERWGADHDAGKAPLDWFWLIGFLAQKAATAQIGDDVEKAKHHTISTAAALANWHAAIAGLHNGMRPGIAQPAEAEAAAHG